jgi:AI-2 transport protein TqsA
MTTATPTTAAEAPAAAPPAGAAPQVPPVTGGAVAQPSMPRALVILLGLAAATVVCAGMQAVSWLIGPAFMALIIVIAVAPVQGYLRRHGWPGWATTLVVVVLVYAILIGLALGVVYSVARLATELPQYAGSADALVGRATARLTALGVGPQQLQQAAGSLNLGQLAGVLGALLSSVAGLATNFVFLLALLLFLGVESSGAGDRMAAIASDRPDTSAALARFAWGTRQYLVVTTVFGLIVAVLDWAALAMLGIPLAATWGLLAFVTNYIPNIGFVIGVIPPALLGLLTGGPELMVVVIVVFCVINFVVQSLIQPRFIGDAVGLSVTVTFMALVFWAWLLGPLGAILAVPLTLLAKALLVDIDPSARWADALLRSSPKGEETGTPPGAGPGEHHGRTHRLRLRRRRAHPDSDGAAALRSDGAGNGPVPPAPG